MKLVLLEGLPKYEGINEAKTLKQGLKLIMKGYDRRRIRSKIIKDHTATNKDDFLQWLQRDTYFLHVSCHGERKKGITRLYITQGGWVTAKDIWNKSDKAKCLKINARVVMVNACETSSKDMREAFFEAGKHRLRYYIAPHEDVPFDEAFLVALLFYKKAFLDTFAKRKYDMIFRSLKYAYNLKDLRTNYWLYPNPFY